jgi:magnesium-transporting ATPase (P-type)
MFLVMLGCASAITVVPGGETTMGVVMGVLLVLSILCAGAALHLRSKFRANPESIIFKSKVLSGICIGISVILTVFLLLGVIG